MHPGDWIAGYAAVVATAAVAWQFLTYWRARLPDLTLRIEPAIIIVDEDGPKTLIALYDGRIVEPVGIEWFFDLRITNHGRARVQVTDIHIAQNASFGRLGWDAGRRANLPLWLEPGEEQSFRFTDDDLDGAILVEVLDIRVLVPMGKEFTASSKIVDSDTALIGSAKMFEGIIAKAGWTDRMFRFEVHELAENHAMANDGHPPSGPAS
jgi:hypothetical protein